MANTALSKKKDVGKRRGYLSVWSGPSGHLAKFHQGFPSGEISTSFELAAGHDSNFFPSSPQRGRDELLCCSTPAAAVRKRKERYTGKVCPTLQKFFIFLPPVPGGTRDYIKCKSAKEEEEELTAPLGPRMRRLHFHSSSPCNLCYTTSVPSFSWRGKSVIRVFSFCGSWPRVFG